MQMSYTSDANNQNVGDKSWHTNGVPNGQPKEVVASGVPEFRPFYWDVKAMRDEQDRPGGWGKDWKRIERAVLTATRAPRFMSEENRKEMQQSPEFWFNPQNAGTFPWLYLYGSYKT